MESAGTKELAAVLPELADALLRTGSAVLCAPPGAGKTTTVPQFLLEQLPAGKKVLMLEPRRIAARAAAARIAQLLGEPCGKTVGYRTRLDSKISSETRIEVVTEGILTRMIQDSPDLPDAGLIIFDEFHERSIHADLALTLAMEARSGLDLPLQILVMSATLDADRISALLGQAPVVACTGRLFPVETLYFPKKDPFAPAEEHTASAVQLALSKTDGDVLVFLPGGGEIRAIQRILEQRLRNEIIAPLYGDLPPEIQDAAIRPDPQGRRKIILATPIAETSLTVEGVRAVVDSGYRKASLFSPRNGMSRLETRRISLASAEQRRGRAGRLAPGLCIRLWSREEESRMAAYDQPEILDADLAPLLLELANWGVRRDTVSSLKWMDPPPVAKLEQAETLLKELGALDQNGAISPHGKAIRKLSLHPRTAHAVLKAQELFHQGYTACLTAALLEDRDPLGGVTCDLRERMSEVLHSGKPLAKRILLAAGKAARSAGVSGNADPEFAGIIMALAYPDRICVARPGKRGEYALSNGTGAKLRVADHLAEEPYLAAADVEGESAKQTIFTAAPVSLEQIQRAMPELLHREIRAGWDTVREIAVAEECQFLGKALLSAKKCTNIPPELLAAGLMEGIRKTGFHVLPFGKAEQSFRARVNFLRNAMPESALPDLSDQALSDNLENWLGPHLTGLTRIEQLKRLNFMEILEGMLTYPQMQLLRKEAPERIEVPSGSEIRLDYETADGIPLLPVRLQEIFGMMDTPKLAGGRIPIAVQMLSPAMRPVQTTRDLRGFWTGSYVLVRKDMRGRYPKHNWPEDPLSAVPTRKRSG